MTLRRKSREFALQMLFQWEMSPQVPARIEANFWKNARAEKKTRTFANQLFEGTVDQVTALDELLARHSAHWRTERMAAVDLNILRLAVYELRSTDTPAKVIFNEAIELAKRFSSEESAPFINGVLDAVAKALGNKSTT